jgi:hypothetical protein
MNISLHIVYQGPAGTPLTAAETKNRDLIRQAAKTTIREAFDSARLAGESDKFVGEVRKEGAERLKRVLKVMIPELNELPEFKETS